MTHRLALALAVTVAIGFASRLTAADPDFSQEVRPILAQFCLKCHGQDEKARKAKLRLDAREAAVEKGAIVPGKPDESELVARVFADDPDVRMPPASTKAQLTDAQKQTLKRWVAAGAEYKQHWAFVKPARPAVLRSRDVQRSEWAKNPIDAFVLDRFEREGQKPSPEADKYTLVRRVYLDLIGLPPTPEEADAFVNDPSPDAYEKLVDRLLASPHYGERWARRWLDLARYADTNGYEKDRPRSIWPYRDWVIRALNADMPFDQFTVEQLAGDLLPNATVEQRIATGFHRNTMLNEEGGIDPLEFRFHAMTDRVATTGTAWLGLTVGCAQCHTHKYDPITQRDYYRLFAFLNNAEEPEMPVRQPEVAAKRKEIETKIAKLVTELPHKFPAGVDADAEFRSWLWRERGKAARWQVLRPTEVTSNLPHLTVEPDDSVFVSGDMSKRDVYDLTFRGDFAGVTAVRLEALPDERLPKFGPGRVYYEGPHGDFHLSTITATAGGKPAKFARASQTTGNAAAAIDDNPQTGWGINGKQGERSVAVFAFHKPLTAGELKLSMVFERYYAAGLGRFRISVTTAQGPAARETPTEIEALLLTPDAELVAEQRGKLRAQFHLTTPHLAKARQEIDALRKQMPANPTTLVMRERPPGNPRPTFLHNRGEFLQPTDKVEPGTPAFLHPFPADAPRNRLGLARWLVSPENPLVARVTVNRQWQAFFGRGLVRTTEDFGFQGDPPTHPELLDWLACEFMEPTVHRSPKRERGSAGLPVADAPGSEKPWSLKHVHKLIVMSATYRQSSRLTPELKERDPENRLIARGPRVRLEAELIRDSTLKAAGLLSPKMYGPSVFPPQPPTVTTEGAYGALPWKPSEGEDRYRRSLYTFSKRTAPYAMYAAFDAPSGEACVARRDVSNTPLQSLTLWNDVMFTEAAQAAGRAMAGKPGSTEEKVTEAFRRFVVRPPTDRELKLLTEFLADQTERLKDHPAEAKKLAGDGPGDTTDRAAWTALARVLMNLDEFVAKN
jgi:hypothetical protein